MIYSPIYSRGPVIRTERMTLWERVTVAGSTRMLSFEREIIWLRESETKVVLTNHDAVLDEVFTMNDHYGFMSSLEGAVKESARLRRQYRIKPGDSLQITAIVSVSDCPVVADTSPEALKQNSSGLATKRYQWIDPDWYTSEHFDKDKGYSRLKPVDVDSLRVNITDGKLGRATRWLKKMREMTNGVSA